MQSLRRCLQDFGPWVLSRIFIFCQVKIYTVSALPFEPLSPDEQICADDILLKVTKHPIHGEVEIV